MLIALLRGINVAGHNRVPMAGLKEACTDAGWAGVQTYIQSGNLLIKSKAKPGAVEKQLEELIAQQFGLSIPVIVRTAKQWSAYMDNNPFPRPSENEPNLVMLALSKKPPKSDAAAALQERATSGERIAAVGDAIWIHFAKGVASSRLAPGLFDKVVGSTVTTRNWRTVCKLHEMAAHF